MSQQSPSAPVVQDTTIEEGLSTIDIDLFGSTTNGLKRLKSAILDAIKPAKVTKWTFVNWSRQAAHANNVTKGIQILNIKSTDKGEPEIEIQVNFVETT